MVYVPHYIDADRFHTDQKTDIVDGGLTSKDVHKIRIPYEKCGKWLPENEFKVQEPTSETGRCRMGICSLLENGPVERSTESRN